MELPEPFKAAILLRYYEDLSPHAIAKRVDAPLETVRARLKRGLQKLRRRLDEDHGGDGRSWVHGSRRPHRGRQGDRHGGGPASSREPSS
jgi:hypothetical protein